MGLVQLVAFLTAIVLIVLCTIWFFRRHQRYLMIIENETARKIGNNEKPDPTEPSKLIESLKSENNWGRKLVFTIRSLNYQEPLENGEENCTEVVREKFYQKKIPDEGGPRAEENKINSVKSEVVENPVESIVDIEDPIIVPAGIKKKIFLLSESESAASHREPRPVEAAPARFLEGGDILMDPLVRAEVVIGEGTKQLLVETNLTLTRPAIKIRNITAEIRNLTTELIQDKIIIQGVLHKQIFFVGEDNVVHHQAENVPFSTFIDIFGAEPGMNVQVHPIIETILFTLITPTLLHQKVVIEFFVKITESNQLNVVEGPGPLVRLDQVIGEDTKQELIESTVALDISAIKIDDITAEIRDLTIEVIEDKVIIQGILHKQIFFIGLDNIEYHQAEDVEFSTFLDVPGASPGMDVVVEPIIEFIHFELLDQDTLLQKVVIEFFVKVTESVQINVVLGPGALLKLDTVVGEDTKQLLVENTVILSQPAVKIREIIAKVERLMAEVIEDKVIIQGIVHKQIFFINENNLEIHQSEDVPFSTFVDIPGAVQGMDVRIKPIIETVLFELLDPVTLRQKVIVELFIKVTESQQLQVQIAAPYGPYYF